ncbi:MAG: alpha/beta fold hydrolase [Bauldia sp.]
MPWRSPLTTRQMTPDLVNIADNEIPAAPRSSVVQTTDGVAIRAAVWSPEKGRARGTVTVIQGRNEFIEKYFETVRDLLDRGFAVATYDWRNQGGSERVLRNGACHVESFADYDRDLDAVMQQIVLPDCPPPYFALAHSMGALSCLRAARDRRVRFERMVLLTPMLELSRFASPPMRVVRFVSGLNLFLGRDRHQISAKPWKRWREADPHRDFRLERTRTILRAAPQLGTGLPTFRWLHASALAMRDAERSAFAAAIRIPALIFIAGADNVVANAPQLRLAEALKSGSQLLLPGARHEILMEADEIRAAFWAGFDAFIPGTPLPAERLTSEDAEHTVV